MAHAPSDSLINVSNESVIAHVVQQGSGNAGHNIYNGKPSILLAMFISVVGASTKPS